MRQSRAERYYMWWNRNQKKQKKNMPLYNLYYISGKIFICISNKESDKTFIVSWLIDVSSFKGPIFDYFFTTLPQVS